MLRFARSLLDTVLGRKRGREGDEDDETAVATKEATNQDDTGSEVNGSKKRKLEDKKVYELVVSNFPVYDIGGIKPFLHSKGCKRIKKAPEWTFARCSFDSKDEAESAMTKLENVTYKGKPLEVELKEFDEATLRNQVKSKGGRKKDQKKAKELEKLNEMGATPMQRLAHQVTPLYDLPYDQQLKKKERIGDKHMMALQNKIATLPELSEESKKQVSWAFEKELPVEKLDIMASPEVTGYRTKCEFTIGRDLDGNPTVGFLLGLYRMGITSVLSPEELLNVSDLSKRIAKAMQDYVVSSEYPVYSREEKEGVWRTLMTKTQRTGDVMIVVQAKTNHLRMHQVDKMKKDLVNYWTIAVKERDIHVTTLLFQQWDGVANGITDKGVTEVLYGDGYIYEELLGCRFRLSSSAFFQVNTPCTELLYAKCAEWCNIDKDKKTTLLDLCCGTGTIGITMAKSVDKVIGVEMVPEAIVDAKENAERNGIKNITYYANKVEDKLSVFKRQGEEEIIAVLDPPRNGVHASVIRAIREARHIDKVIFISCDAKQALPNFLSLCRPQSNRFKGSPFKPVRYVSVDLFPHTDHCELMIEFARIKSNE